MGQPVVHFEIIGKDGPACSGGTPTSSGGRSDANNPMKLRRHQPRRQPVARRHGHRRRHRRGPRRLRGPRHVLRRRAGHRGRAAEGRGRRRHAHDGAGDGHGRHRDRPVHATPRATSSASSTRRCRTGCRAGRARMRRVLPAGVRPRSSPAPQPPMGSHADRDLAGGAGWSLRRPPDGGGPRARPRRHAGRGAADRLRLRSPAALGGDRVLPLDRRARLHVPARRRRADGVRRHPPGHARPRRRVRDRRGPGRGHAPPRLSRADVPDRLAVRRGAPAVPRVRRRAARPLRAVAPDLPPLDRPGVRRRQPPRVHRAAGAGRHRADGAPHRLARAQRPLARGRRALRAGPDGRLDRRPGRRGRRGHARRHVRVPRACPTACRW